MTRRALALAGGGMKVAWQAGVLQVLLDEAGLTFDFVDAASGGVFNAAMLCQGKSGTEIADAWRRFRPLRGAAVNWRHPTQSLFTMERFRRNVLEHDWGLDWVRIRGTDLHCRFNVFDVARQQNRVVPAADMTEDLLVAAVALPMWFPPVDVDGSPHIDAVYVTDANLGELVDAGADELWVIWTVDRRGVWRGGFLNQYFQVIEAAANGRYHDDVAAVRARGVEVHEIDGQVPLNYLLNFNPVRFAEAVEDGVRAARQWCDDRGLPHGARRPAAPPTPAAERVSLTFREPFGGRLVFGATDPDDGLARQAEGFDIRALAHMTVDDMAVYLASPDHELKCDGWLDAPELGGRLRVLPGSGGVRLNTDVAGSPWEKRMTYRLPFADGTGHPLTLFGEKVVRNDPGFDLWHDTTRFRTQLLDGQVDWDDLRSPANRVVAAGVLEITLGEFTRSLLTYRAKGPTRAKALAGHAAFIRLFVGKLWDVYASHLSTYSPL